MIPPLLLWTILVEGVALLLARKNNLIIIGATILIIKEEVKMTHGKEAEKMIVAKEIPDLIARTLRTGVITKRIIHLVVVKKGVEKIIEFKLTSLEKKQFNKSVTAVRNLTSLASKLINKK